MAYEGCTSSHRHVNIPARQKEEREGEVFFHLKGTMQRLLTSHLLTFSLAGLGHLATSTEIRETETKSSLAERPNPQRKLKGPVTRKEGTASSQSLRGPRTKSGLGLGGRRLAVSGARTHREQRGGLPSCLRPVGWESGRALINTLGWFRERCAFGVLGFILSSVLSCSLALDKERDLRFHIC